MELLKAQAPLIYMILKTLWDVICTGTISMLIAVAIFLTVWFINRTYV